MRKRNRVILTSVAEMLAYRAKWPHASISAILHGLLTRVNSKKVTMFLVLTDGTGSIQVVLERDKFTDEQWASARTLREVMRVRVEGEVGQTNIGRVSVFVSSVPSVIPDIPRDISSSGWPNVEVERIGHQIYLARIRKRCSEYLMKKGFTEIEPRFVTTLWNGKGVGPLRVDYPGFGMPTFLVPSPSSQILKTIATIGTPKVFAISRCFTSDYRCAMDSTESVIACGKILNISMNQLLRITEDTLKYICEEVLVLLNQQAYLKIRWSRKELPWPPVGNSGESNQPEVQVFHEFESEEDELFGKRRIQVFRFCWPDAGNTSRMIVADGSTESFEGGLRVGSFNLHLERITQLLQSTSIRTLFDLGYKKRV